MNVGRTRTKWWRLWSVLYGCFYLSNGLHLALDRYFVTRCVVRQWYTRTTTIMKWIGQAAVSGGMSGGGYVCVSYVNDNDVGDEDGDGSVGKRRRPRCDFMWSRLSGNSGADVHFDFAVDWLHNRLHDGLWVAFRHGYHICPDSWIQSGLARWRTNRVNALRRDRIDDKCLLQVKMHID